MKTVDIRWILIICVLFLLFIPSASAQDEDEEQATDDTCVLGTFCGVIMFILFLFYISTRKRSRNPQYQGGPRTQGYPPMHQDHGYPPPPTYPSPRPRSSYPRQPPRPKDIKCNLCGSSSLRHFEEGYAKCSDCKHVMYTLRGPRRR